MSYVFRISDMSTEIRSYISYWLRNQSKKKNLSHISELIAASNFKRHQLTLDIIKKLLYYIDNYSQKTRIVKAKKLYIAAYGYDELLEINRKLENKIKKLKTEIQKKDQYLKNNNLLFK